MEETLEKLQSLLAETELKADDFYSIRINDHDLILQGKYNDPNIKKAINLFGAPKVDGGGYLNFNDGIVNVVLTP